jgi:hypothetical protein
MVQSVKTVVNGRPIITDPSQESRSVVSGPGQGRRIDRQPTENNPIFGARSLETLSLADTPRTDRTKYQLGRRRPNEKGENAWMYDEARITTNNSSMTFETAALAIEGEQKGTYYGSVEWGFETGADGAVKLIDFKSLAAGSAGKPSSDFLASAALWNLATTRGTLVARNAPTQVYEVKGGEFAPAYTIAKGTKVKPFGSPIVTRANVYLDISIDENTTKEKRGYMRVADLQDKGGGKATVDLPLPIPIR